MEELGARVLRQAARAFQDGQVVVDHLAEQRGAPLGEFLVGVEVVEDPLVLVEDVEVLAADRLEDVAALAPLPVVDADPVQHGDPLGADQRAERPGGVLVVAGREGEPRAGDEVAPVGLVPHDLEQVEQLGALGEGEGVRALLLEHVGPQVRADPAVPVGARVVEDQDLGIARGLDPVPNGRQRTVRQRVVTVQEQHVIAGGLFQSGVARATQPHVFREVNHMNPVVAFRVLVENGP